ncbi:corrinoid activation/regeneration protein AcsV [Clostridium formicaceticum]|uniref:CDP-6-deoxy-L-threo-D-glycero-4-hexulose-3-dehydrase reductase n=1 Tax=Clostridium formicaceticum TaxID=1497 RepID=A0AAC9RJS9_9CLOT|nr:corrinoid activation/regeneration protein AcsV [Clostridium formicaceticum]AOY76413.1 ferredoxin [Clostridium formicaceticum]ARE86807.1 CDP-6-deoxy-L-threo-D-glycero-4-hexulose-3-dehydrase reductase [Clostridium formicaceticum]
MINVKFIPAGIEIKARIGENLLEIARRENIFIDAPCNGSLSCGKCKVKIIQGNVETEANRHIKEEELQAGYVLACGTKVIEDIVVEVVEGKSSYLAGMKIEDLSGPKDKEIFERAKAQILDNGMKFSSYVKKDYIMIEAPTLDDNISDWDRMKRYLRNQLGYSKVFCRLPILRKIPSILRESDFEVTITHIPRGKNRTMIVNIEAGDTTDRLYGIALDIGTTSVAACLVDLYKGELLAKASAGNAQMKYGADVIHRIIYATKNKGLEQLSHAVIHETINPLLVKMYHDAGIDKEEVIAFVAAGNTTMSHLLLGIYPDYLRLEPYIPTFSNAPFIKASELELEMNSETFLYITPSIASYVGGDITAGVLASGIWTSDENVLLIDLGTNGEIVFGNKDYMVTCACSAGPAFEGGEISSGMRAAGGAIERVEIEAGTFKPKLTIINNEKPKGICGSGIIDLIAEMLKTGLVDRRGKLNRNLDSNRVRFDDYNIGEYVLAFKEEWDIHEDITITEIDIDNFIKAKGAVYSGVSTLITSLGMDISIIDKIYIAGGIGNSLSIDRAIEIGLFPDIEKEKFVYIGNSSLMGCYLTLMSEDARKKLEEISNQMTYIELSVYPTYMDEFISACFLPHTDIERFPTVEKILKNNKIC